MDIDLPDTISPETIQQAAAAAATLRERMADGRVPPGLTAEALGALLLVVDAVMEAASGDNTDLSPSDAAKRLRVARPTVMRLIARGELSSHKDGGHYVLSPRELRSFQTRLASNRRDALSDLAATAEEFGF
jgi:excisionase family DNA binding protein